jgi:hypothetical protein
MTDAHIRLRTLTVDRTERLPGWSTGPPGWLRSGDGSELLLLSPPAVRRWDGDVLVQCKETAYTLRDEGGGVVVETDGRAELDVLETDPLTAAEARADRSPRMTLLGPFSPLGTAADLGRFLVGGRVLDTNDFAGRRCPSEQTALALYRTSRLRGGSFWSAVAGAVAEWTAARLTSSQGAPCHGVYGGREVHTRFLADAVLLVQAEHERTRDARYGPAVDAGLSGLDALTVPFVGGSWTLHDSDERDERKNHLVLNTHVQALTARYAAGVDITAYACALVAALRLRPSRLDRWRHAVAVAADDVRSGWLGRPAGGGYAAAAATSRLRPYLALPSGWLARHTGLGPAPAYLTVNLHDLAALTSNIQLPTAAAALRRGLRYALASGYFRAQRRTGEPQCAVQPVALRMAGRSRQAVAAAAAAYDAGWAPAVGWPGCTDRLWSRLAEGTP